MSGQRANAREKLYPRIRAEAVALEAGQGRGLASRALDERGAEREDVHAHDVAHAQDLEAVD